MTGNCNGIDAVKCICFFNANMFLVIKKQKNLVVYDQHSF